MQRCCAIEIAALAAMTPAQAADAVPYFFHTQESFPYFTHRLGTTDYEENSEELEIRERQIIIRLVVAHLTEGFKGAPEERLFDYIGVLETAFSTQDARQLTAADPYDEVPDYLYPTDTRFTTNGGLRVFENTGFPVRQVGTEFTFVIPFFAKVYEE
jgi:hypothetical protein